MRGAELAAEFAAGALREVRLKMGQLNAREQVFGEGSRVAAVVERDAGAPARGHSETAGERAEHEASREGRGSTTR